MRAYEFDLVVFFYRWVMEIYMHFHMFWDDKMMARHTLYHFGMTSFIGHFIYCLCLSLWIPFRPFQMRLNVSRHSFGIIFISDLVRFFCSSHFLWPLSINIIIVCWLPGYFSERLCWQCQRNWNRMHNVWMCSWFQCVFGACTWWGEYHI